ncbi:MAG: hypothetical protein AUK44_00555 [Porphyromonadaceae bacterium CG2_30_38_12]|nr:MAG: hypothetical protein AUK44_00555 [Porphyromonadaceae bacterium CG2_30_38_12]
MLKNYAVTQKIDVIDLNPIIADKNQVLLDKYTTDGVHINDLGYKLWSDEIKRKLRKYKI